MFDFIKGLRAKRKLDVALKILLFGREEVEGALRKRYSGQWTGFIKDIANGANPHEQAVALITIFLLDVMGNEMRPEQARAIAKTINDENFVSRAPIFDVIDQVGYFTLLAERSGEIRNGVAAMFAREIAGFFSDDPDIQSRVREYLLQSMMRFRELAHGSLDHADTAQSAPGT